LSATLPRVHIVLASIEKVVPTLEDTSVLLRLLARSATGQEITSYTTFFTGPRRGEDADGPEQFHVVLVDNGRSRMLGGAYHEMLRCIRCGACLNHCPVYSAVGGMPMAGSIRGRWGGVDALDGRAGRRPAAAQCVDPVRTLRGSLPHVHPAAETAARTSPAGIRAQARPPRSRWALAAWAFCARRPLFYRWVMRFGVVLLNKMSSGRGRFRSLPFAQGWTAARDLPAPQGDTFMAQWQRRKHMNDSRAAILGRISQALGHEAAADAPAVMQRVNDPARGPQPQWAEALRERFLAKLAKVAGTYAEVTSDAEIVQTVGDYLATQHLPQRLVAAPIRCWPGSSGRKPGRWSAAARTVTTASASP